MRSQLVPSWRQGKPVAAEVNGKRSIKGWVLGGAFLLVGLAACHKTDSLPTTTPLAEHLLLGNPSHAEADTSQSDNYLLIKAQYVLSYNRSRGIPNWVSWHLDKDYLGNAQRQNDFRPDASLSPGWYQVTPNDYMGSGFDRGHLCPSADRTRSVADNQATFLMSNILPQAPDNNQGPWAELEEYCRTLVNSGKELYITAGSYGQGGTGSNGALNRLSNGKVAVPAYTWKLILILEEGSDDLSRVNEQTRLVVVWVPNRQGIRQAAWDTYRISADELEAKTGYDFLSAVSSSLQNSLENRVDIGPVH